MINKVEDLENKGLGADPNDKRGYNDAEFDFVCETFRTEPTFEKGLKYLMMTLWAHTLIHRMDDTAHFKVGAPHGDIEFPFTIKTRTKWSKNV